MIDCIYDGFYTQMNRRFGSVLIDKEQQLCWSALRRVLYKRDQCSDAAKHSDYLSAEDEYPEEIGNGGERGHRQFYSGEIIPAFHIFVCVFVFFRL